MLILRVRADRPEIKKAHQEAEQPHEQALKVIAYQLHIVMITGDQQARLASKPRTPSRSTRKIPNRVKQNPTNCRVLFQNPFSPSLMT
jgi:hypothetical protein